MGLTRAGGVRHDARPRGRAIARLLEVPELPVAAFAFVLHFVWEMLQIDWFEGMSSAPHARPRCVCAPPSGTSSSR